ncbi:helix-turn-helix domain-containing protein [Streptantibioticus cattleyicolor]|uniref:WD-40 repeat-containing protein n=1 Tax=Streptantibioticus cattleyicolor (strain ATCC 35852 / DSM 46488 / JCM 4925 / NBRC 14057 / NRRL 8057) TaxID=1003195 RepID=F8JMY6_STREN|nr:helix-turn-helix transcriptional regulator [Streptantibioticus cattleyicolor]AEW98573.1 WD-40 repeat-containing protein [Streptantibioticus cattleyicolor NRRL 8057 = DSM 46488]CCB72369.1 protein of unknown function [Streptantibioticus cattleyicolor NRRL 8057 = DSM 46488]
MPRPERPIDPSAGPAQRFALELRRLRQAAGNPSYRTMAEHAHYSGATLSEAARGLGLPSLAVTLAYVTACGGDPAEWEQRWREVAARLGRREPAATPSPPPEPPVAAVGARPVPEPVAVGTQGRTGALELRSAALALTVGFIALAATALGSIAGVLTAENRSAVPAVHGQRLPAAAWEPPAGGGYRSVPGP